MCMSLGSVAFVAAPGSNIVQRCGGILDGYGVSWRSFPGVESLRDVMDAHPTAATQVHVAVLEATGASVKPEMLPAEVEKVRRWTDLEVVVLGPSPTAELFLDILNAGASEYCRISSGAKDIEAACLLVRRICEDSDLVPDQARPVMKSKAGRFLGRSDAILKAVSEAAKALSEDAVLFQGESGSGKSFLARAVISKLHPARMKRFVHVDCGALTDSLHEAALFGWLGESFSGSGKKERPGLFEQADTGVLFLDEIGHLSPAHQNALLVAMDSDPDNPFKKTFRKIGGKEAKADVQVIAATQYDLKARVQSGAFSEPLYYRLARYCVTLPPLRRRCEDIPYLAERLMWKECARMGREGVPRRFTRINEDAVALLQRYPWPGNVRELSNVIAFVVRMNRGTTIEAELLPDYVRCDGPVAAQRLYGEALLRLRTRLDAEELDRLAREFHTGETVLADGTVARVSDALPADMEERARLARRLHISRSTLYPRLRDLSPD